jgi:polyphosphate kinase
MHEAGVRVTLRKARLKVHSKVAIIKLSDHENGPQLGIIGTGNFNEKTAQLYSDIMLITSDPVIVQELQQIANFLFTTKEPPATRHLLVAPFNLQSSCLHLIDQEIRAARQQRPARIVLKLNNLEDPVMIRKLYQASQAGVEITLLVRSICCLRPQVPGLSDNITVIRLVDRYLEHARVYWFHGNGTEKMYLSSADWMQRNLHRRVEVGVPITNAVHRAQLQQWLQLQLQDTAKAVTLSSRLENKHPARSGASVRAQEASYQWLKEEEDIYAHLFPVELS